MTLMEPRLPISGRHGAVWARCHHPVSHHWTGKRELCGVGLAPTLRKAVRMMGHRMAPTWPNRAETYRDQQPWLHKCHRGLVPSKHHVDSSDSDRDSPFLDNRSPGSRGESNRIPPPSLLGRHSTGRTAPRLPPRVRTAAELAKPASHTIEGGALKM